MSDVQDISIRMQDLIHFIEDASESVRSGVMTDLQGLDEEVASLCDRTISLPPEQALEVQPLMAEMISRLEDLGRALKEFQDQHAKPPQQ